MRSEIMERVLEKYIYEMLTIYKKLNEEVTPVSLDEIYQEISMDRRTLQKNLEELNAACIILEFRFIGKEVHYKLNEFSGKEVYGIILKKSRNINFIYKILMDKQRIDDLSESLHVSVSTIRRIIKQWNQFFGDIKWDIVINSNNVVMLQGDEQLIRQMYQHLILLVFRKELHQNPAFFKVQHELDYYFKRHFKDSSHQIDSNYIGIYIHVAIIRQKNGHFMRKAPNFFTKDFTDFYISLKMMSGLKDLLWKYYRSKISVRTIKDIFPFNVPKLLPSLKLYPRKKYVYKKITLIGIDYMVKELDYYFKLSLDKTQLDKRSEYLYTALATSGKIDYFIYNHYNAFFDENIYPNIITLNRVSTIINNNSELDDIDRNLIFYQIMQSFPELNHLSMLNKEVLIYTERGTIFREYLETAILNKFTNVKVQQLEFKELIEFQNRANVLLLVDSQLYVASKENFSNVLTINIDINFWKKIELFLSRS